VKRVGSRGATDEHPITGGVARVAAGRAPFGDRTILAAASTACAVFPQYPHPCGQVIVDSLVDILCAECGDIEILSTEILVLLADYY
jgi:hypothetical protein